MHKKLGRTPLNWTKSKRTAVFSSETIPNNYEDCDHDCDDADNERNARSAEGTWQELHHSHTPPFLTPIFIYILFLVVICISFNILDLSFDPHFDLNCRNPSRDELNSIMAEVRHFIIE